MVGIAIVILVVWLLFSLGSLSKIQKPFQTKREAAISIIFTLMTVGALLPWVIPANSLPTFAGIPASISDEDGVVVSDAGATTAETTKQAEPTTDNDKLMLMVAQSRWKEAASFAKNLPSVTNPDQYQGLASLIESVAPTISDAPGKVDAYTVLHAIAPNNETYKSKLEALKKFAADQHPAHFAEFKKKLLKDFTKGGDDFNGITFYTHKSFPSYISERTAIYPYIGEKNGRYWLRLEITYTSTDWLFANAVYVNIDGVRQTLYQGDFKRDNCCGSIWEWADVMPDSDQLAMLRSMATAKEVKIRYEGSQYYNDFVLKAKDQEALAQTLAAYDRLRGPDL